MFSNRYLVAVAGLIVLSSFEYKIVHQISALDRTPLDVLAAGIDEPAACYLYVVEGYVLDVFVGCTIFVPSVEQNVIGDGAARGVGRADVAEGHAVYATGEGLVALYRAEPEVALEPHAGQTFAAIDATVLKHGVAKPRTLQGTDVHGCAFVELFVVVRVVVGEEYFAVGQTYVLIGRGPRLGSHTEGVVAVVPQRRRHCV